MVQYFGYMIRTDFLSVTLSLSEGGSFLLNPDAEHDGFFPALNLKNAMLK